MKIKLYNGDRVKVIAEGIVLSVVSHLDKWQHLPDRLFYYEKGAMMSGRRIRVQTCELKEL